MPTLDKNLLLLKNWLESKETRVKVLRMYDKNIVNLDDGSPYLSQITIEDFTLMYVLLFPTIHIIPSTAKKSYGSGSLLCDILNKKMVKV